MHLSRERTGWSASRLFPPSAGPLRPGKEKRKSPAPFGRLLGGARFSLDLSCWPLSCSLSCFLERSQSPVETLRRHALALGDGEEREQVPVESILEFKDLADTFNVMAENLRMRQAALRESEERFSRVSEPHLRPVGQRRNEGRYGIEPDGLSGEIPAAEAWKRSPRIGATCRSMNASRAVQARSKRLPTPGQDLASASHHLRPEAGHLRKHVDLTAPAAEKD